MITCQTDSCCLLWFWTKLSELRKEARDMIHRQNPRSREERPHCPETFVSGSEAHSWTCSATELWVPLESTKCPLSVPGSSTLLVWCYGSNLRRLPRNSTQMDPLTTLNTFKKHFWQDLLLRHRCSKSSWRSLWCNALIRYMAELDAERGCRSRKIFGRKTNSRK